MIHTLMDTLRSIFCFALSTACYRRGKWFEMHYHVRLLLENKPDLLATPCVKNNDAFSLTFRKFYSFHWAHILPRPLNRVAAVRVHSKPARRELTTWREVSKSRAAIEREIVVLRSRGAPIAPVRHPSHIVTQHDVPTGLSDWLSEGMVSRVDGFELVFYRVLYIR